MLLFEFFMPLITGRAIQYTNGADGRRRHRLFAETFGEAACANIMPALNKVRLRSEQITEVTLTLYIFR